MFTRPAAINERRQSETKGRRGGRHGREKRKGDTLLKFISALKNVRKARGTILPMEGNPRHPGSFSPPLPLYIRCPPLSRFWPQPDHSVSSFNELSTNRDCRAFERDGGVGLIYQRCRQCIRYSFGIPFARDC